MSLEKQSDIPDSNGHSDDTSEENNEDPAVQVFTGSEEKDINISMKSWSLRHNITHRALKDLLQIMRHQYNDQRLPADPRTLLDTPQSTGKLCIEMAGGKYWHFGLQKCLEHWFVELAEDISISININIDGLPIHKSSKFQLWPILCNVHSFSNLKPMPVGIFFGKSKPTNVNDFLTPFVNELIPILQNGCTVNGHKIKTKIRCFICDSPARAFVKGWFIYRFKIYVITNISLLILLFNLI